jgi:hypothetical protein
MRTSGASSTDGLLFVLPAVIFLAFFVWAYGEPTAVVAACDRFLRHAWTACVAWLGTVV